MRTTETVSALAGFERRGAGTEAERRAAMWLRQEAETAGREAQLEAFWSRPNWALTHAWHVALALAGSLVSVSSPRVGGALLLVALLSIIADALTGVSPGRRLTPERASQNVVSGGQAGDRVRLIVTANYDAGRVGLAYHERVRALTAGITRASRGLAPGWLGWIALATTALLTTAILRLGGTRGAAIGVAQLIPTIGLVLTLALLLELASSDVGPAAGDNATGVAVAAALVRALDAAPPRHLSVELVLQGAGDTTGLGIRHYLRRHKRELNAANTVVLGIAACTDGRPRWWTSDGPLVPLRHFRRLRAMCARIAEQEPALRAAPHRGRGVAPAHLATAARLPAITVGCLDEREIVPGSHRHNDSADAIDRQALDAALEFALTLVDAIDAHVGQTRAAQLVSS
jgi:hypothetical protein